MLVEARMLRRAAVAYCRNSGSVPKLARALHVPRWKAEAFVNGEIHWVTPALAQRILGLLDPHSRAYVEQNLRRFPVCSGKIPSDVIAPVVREAISEEGSITGLAHLTGLHQRRLHALLYAREEAVGRGVADQLISRSLGPARWLEPDLRRWYFSTDSVLSTTTASWVRQPASARREATLASWAAIAAAQQRVSAATRLGQFPAGRPLKPG